MVLRITGIFLLALSGLHAEPTAAGKSVAASIKLTDPNGKSVNPLANEGQRATVLIFLTTDCPLCNTYAPEIGRIVADYKESGVRVYGVYAGESAKEISRHLKDYKLQLTAVLDPTLQLATLIGATVTPEACVLNAGGEVMYRGRIDDRAVKLGTVRAEPKQRDLRLAIEAVLLKKPVPEKFTKAIGCYLPIPNSTKSK